ncbi:MAG: isoprenylcysteine carboxylmethyltransferase family protein [Proteobacteria bacterium]|nr:isoprenylcysteine carboxylmethyltransferase family protein [Pseudomonadota bacterium]
MWWLDRHAPVIRILSVLWTYVGWALIAVGVLMDSVSVVAFIRAKTTVNPLRVERASHLVVTGLYRVTRNPMYLGLIALLSGWATVLGSASPWLVLVVFERVLVIFQIRPEEAALAARFGPAYTQYARQVNRWLGRARS